MKILKPEFADQIHMTMLSKLHQLLVVVSSTTDNKITSMPGLTLLGLHRKFVFQK